MKFNQKIMLLALSLAFIATSLNAAKRGRTDQDSSSSSDEEEEEETSQAATGRAVLEARAARMRQRTTAGRMTADELARARAHEERETLLQQQAAAALAVAGTGAAAVAAVQAVATNGGAGAEPDLEPAVVVAEAAVAPLVPAAAIAAYAQPFDTWSLTWINVNEFLDYGSRERLANVSKGHNTLASILSSQLIAKYLRETPEENPLTHVLQNKNASPAKINEALCFACENNLPDFAILMLNHGATQSFSDIFGNTALMHAVENGSIEIVRALLTTNPNINALNTNDQTALMIAADKHFVEIMELLHAAGADVSPRNRHSPTALMIAAKFGGLEAVQALLAAGANINVTDNRIHTTALIEAVQSQQLKAVRVLLAAGADVNIRNSAGNTALFYANGSAEIVQALLSAGANVNFISGKTVLIYAMREGFFHIAELLLAAGANINTHHNSNRHTELMIAAKKGTNLALVNFLLTHGANPFFTGRAGETALDLARAALAEAVSAGTEGLEQMAIRREIIRLLEQAMTVQSVAVAVSATPADTDDEEEPAA